MQFSTTSLTLLSLLGLTSAVPTHVDLAPRCGTTIYPTTLQSLSEASPSTSYPNTLLTTSNFHVSQSIDTSGKVNNRIYQIATFSNIPAGAYACQLNVKLPSPSTLTTTGNPTLNVTTLYKDTPSSIVYPNTWSWSTFFPTNGGALGQGLFGTQGFTSGTSQAINSEVCPPGGGSLAFIFAVASWVGTSSSVDFTQYVNTLNGQGLTGVYLTHSC
ncbi:hypothetical protein B0J14DRAFT_587222 [Halenospora varia]|nr:hypothetical protein B0J14DRAFT_587222 [Halenospora varia]